MSLIYSPGPAAYELGSTIGRAPAASMKGRYKTTDTRNVPGPGTYKLSDAIGVGNAPSYTLRPKTNIPADLHDAPGPGAYNHDTHKGKGPAISMAPRLDLKGLTDAVPGPGSYQSPYEVGKEAPKYSMTGRGAGSNEGIRSPGPGQPQKRAALSMYSRSFCCIRFSPSFCAPFPSLFPGAYNVDAPRSAKAASMKSRHYDKPDAFQPGPGAYKLSDSIGGSNAPAYTMRPKPDPRNSAGPSGVPGPGAYTLGSTLTSPGKSMTARRDPKAASESVPGPGAYKLSDSIGNGHAPSYTLRPKTNVPADLQDAPGPGAYNHDTHKGKGPAISMAPRLDLKGLTDAVPGPGSYQSPYEVGKEAPKYTMTGRGAGSNEGIRSPGPGQFRRARRAAQNTLSAATFQPCRPILIIVPLCLYTLSPPSQVPTTLTLLALRRPPR
jgi:hypothetical protein